MSSWVPRLRVYTRCAGCLRRSHTGLFEGFTTAPHFTGVCGFGGWAPVLGFGADAGGGPKYLPTLAPRVEAAVFGATLVGHDLGTCLRVPPLSL